MTRTIGGLLAAGLLAACGGDATSPPVGVTGLWRGHTPLGSPTDSILLILVDSTNGVSASAAWTPAAAPRREMLGGGQVSGTRLALTLSLPLRPPGPSFSLEFDLLLSGGTLAGTMADSSSARQGPITLRRTLPASSALVGTWVLTAVRGIAVTPGPDYTDTLTLAADGRARRAFETTACGFVVNGLHDSRRGWLQLEFLASSYLTESQCGYRSRDSLEVRGPTLTRYTRLAGGVTLEEDFARR